VTTAFTYNGDGLRDSLTTGGNTTTFTWDVNRSIPQVLDDEDLRYVYGVGRIAQVDGADTYYYLTDGLGSTMALTDEDGDVVNDYDYDVFGALRDSSGSQANDFTFAGEQVDGSTGLQYLRARYYDTAVGRLMSRDEYPGVAESPASQNRFSYVLNRPTTYNDPSGHCLGPLAKACGGKNNWINKKAGEVYDAVDSVVKALTPSKPSQGAVDYNLSACPIVCVTAGLLQSTDGTWYWYAGTGIGISMPAFTVTITPFPVSEGTSCELAVTSGAYAAQGGVALGPAGFNPPKSPKYERGGSDLDPFYVALGATIGPQSVVPVGGSWTCFQVSPL
jgi:RHS repeat-associated protein